MNKKIIDSLYADFEKVEERRGLGGKTFKYLKPAPVIHRLNKDWYTDRKIPNFAVSNLELKGVIILKMIYQEGKNAGTF